MTYTISLTKNELFTSGSVAKAIDLIFTNENTNTIQGVDFKGSNLTTLISSGLDSPRSIAYNSNNDLIYFTDTNNGAIKRATTSGASVTTLFSGLTDPSGIALDLTNGHIYFTEDGTRVRRANLRWHRISNDLDFGAHGKSTWDRARCSGEPHVLGKQ